MLYDEKSLKRLENKDFGEYERRLQKYLAQDRKELIKEYYKLRTGDSLNIDNPVTYNEKLQWLKYYWRDNLVYRCADKYEARFVVAEMGCPKIVDNPLFIYKAVSDIDFSVLPESFVLKATHSSGFNLFVQNKNNLDIERVKNVFEKILKIQYYTAKCEWCYEHIEPKIICENLLQINTDAPLDYKFFCFHGEVKFVQILTANKWVYNREPIELIVDKDFKRMDFSYGFPNLLNVSKSNDFDKMVEYAEKLSKPFPHVRIDLYNPQNGVIKFGEFTFFPGAGYDEFNPREYGVAVGNWLNLNNIEKITETKQQKWN